jgi:hypothetical protein
MPKKSVLLCKKKAGNFQRLQPNFLPARGWFVFFTQPLFVQRQRSPNDEGNGVKVQRTVYFKHTISNIIILYFITYGHHANHHPAFSGASNGNHAYFLLPKCSITRHYNLRSAHEKRHVAVG